jgi:V8-like Glu-specific endopeptidase
MKLSKCGLVLLIFTWGSLRAMSQQSSTLHLSHDSTVLVLLNGGLSKGSGFMVSNDLAVTCLHVVSVPNVVVPGSQNLAPQKIEVIMPSGEQIEAKLVSIPTAADPTPAQYDFAFLKLVHKPSKPVETLSFASRGQLQTIELGDEVAFSGYPLNTPGMVTHKGMISGSTPDKSLLFIQASVNKGNSGGALVDKDGSVIGIVSLREGGLSPALQNLRGELAASAQSGVTVTMARLNPVIATGMLIDTIDEYISVGIGYARNASFAKAYLERHPEIEK